jgi:hypothetical protein
MPDPFASTAFSLILAWILTVPILIGLLCYLANVIFAGGSGAVERLFTIWFAFSILVFSPLRYILLQIVTATAYSVQSIGAFVSCFVLVLYIAIIYGLLYAVGVGLPFLALFGSL